ncbi:MAG: HAMP domain-containing protein [Burkholderiaceae bacterium]|nr:HAMP domain-containing protein [Burkholderiaceae bacterium]
MITAGALTWDFVVDREHTGSQAPRSCCSVALKRTEMVVSDVLFARVMNRPSIAFAKAMRNDNGSVTGVLILILDLKWLGRELAARHPPEGTRLAVLDFNGDVAVSLPADEQWIGRNPGQSEMFQKIRDAQAAGTFESNDPTGETRFVAHATLLKTVSGPIYLLESMPIDSVLADVRQDTVIKFAAAIGLLLAVMGAVIRGVNRLAVQPMEKLAEAARLFSEGNLHARSGLKQTRDEIGQLALAIDQAALAIARRAQSAARAKRGLSVLYAGNQAVQRASDELAPCCRTCVASSCVKGATALRRSRI